MRRMRYIFALVVLLFAAASCQRRPFNEATTAISLVLELETQIVQENALLMPELMKVCFCDPATGRVVYTDYVGPEGGYVHPYPGDYKLLVYSFGMESTIMRNEDNFCTVEAYTNEVSSFIKSQMAEFLTKRSEMASKAGDDTKGPEEKIVNEPDHVFVATEDNVHIPALLAGENEHIVISMKAETVVETWKVVFENVEGTEWISSVRALISGMVESEFISTRRQSENAVTIYFEMFEGEDQQSLVGTFRTFGKHPMMENNLSLDLNITDTGGNQHNFHFDITEQFNDNDEMILVVEDDIKIEKPQGGGGFAPEVDDWKDVITNIEL